MKKSVKLLKFNLIIIMRKGIFYLDGDTILELVRLREYGKQKTMKDMEITHRA